jgi:hypothetical protein
MECQPCLSAADLPPTDLSPIDPSPIDPRSRAAAIKSALKQAGLTLTQLSALSSDRFGKASPYFLPPTFLHKLVTRVTPHVCQIAALSVITPHGFADWMSAFGFDLSQIPRLQVQLHREHTVLVTPVETDTHGSAVRTPAIDSVPQTRTVTNNPDHLYLYAKIGTADSPAFPELVPGSIVRVDTRSKGFAGFSDDAGSGPIYLVERVGGLTCCRVKQVDDRHILLLSRQSAQSSFPLKLDEEARILGTVDTELRPTEATQAHNATADSGSTASLLNRNSQNTPKLCALLKKSRERSGLTFRSAHDISISVAQALRDKHYAISIGLLSDYETISSAPRHTAKIMTLCILYGIDFFRYLRCAGIQYDNSLKSPLPARTGAQKAKQPLTWPAFQKGRTDFPRSIVEAQTQAIRSFSWRRIAV